MDHGESTSESITTTVALHTRLTSSHKPTFIVRHLKHKEVFNQLHPNFTVNPTNTAFHKELPYTNISFRIFLQNSVKLELVYSFTILCSDDDLGDEFCNTEALTQVQAYETEAYNNNI